MLSLKLQLCINVVLRGHFFIQFQKYYQSTCNLTIVELFEVPGQLSVLAAIQLFCFNFLEMSGLEEVGIPGPDHLREALTNCSDPLAAIEEFQVLNCVHESIVCLLYLDFFLLC